MAVPMDKIIALIVFLPPACTFPESVSRNLPPVLQVAHNTTILLTCRGIVPYPLWYVNETLTEHPQYTVRNLGENEFVGELTISGNETSGILDLRCKERNSTVYINSIRLTVQGPLPPPENVTISEHLNSSTIEWNPPYSAVNNESDIISVDPHITHYTVYITDNYTGNIIVKENVTESRFPFNIQNDSLCPMYQVSAWNAGGEGEPSEPVQENTPQGEQAKVFINLISRASHSYQCLLFPSDTVENISAIPFPEFDSLHVHIKVNVTCTSRTPKFHCITVMNSAGEVLNETQRQHQPGEVADFTISLPQNVDVCSLHVKIRAGNSAGMSAPSEAVQVDCSSATTDSTTASATTVLTVTSGSEDNRQQGVNTTLIVIIIGVVAAVGGVLIVAVGIICCIKQKSKNSKVKHSDQTDNLYTGSPSLGGPNPLYKLPAAETVDVITEQTTSRPVAGDPEQTAFLMHTLDSTPSTLQTSFAMAPQTSNSHSAVSGRSDDLLLPPSPPVPASRPNLVYEQVDVQQTQVPPPANDDHVRYVQIKQQDKM